MNYLAHIFLSGSKSQLQVGNFIGDFVKGSRFNDYPKHIRDGILLHRRIDEYTDSHPLVKQNVEFLRPEFGRYSGIISDMYFDYFLAANFNQYAGMSLSLFAYRFYMGVLVNYRHLPERVKKFIFHFVGTNRLSKYATHEGLQESLQIMAGHKVPALDPQKIICFLQENHETLENTFQRFFPDLMAFAANERAEKINQP